MLHDVVLSFENVRGTGRATGSRCHRVPLPRLYKSVKQFILTSLCVSTEDLSI